MNLYLVSQNENNGYDTFDSFVCSARCEEAARRITPQYSEFGDDYSAWCSSPDIPTVVKIGRTHIPEEKIILASFNVG